MSPEITGITATTFTHPIENLGTLDGLNTVYLPGSTSEKSYLAVQIETDAGVTGEYIADNVPPAVYLSHMDMVAEYLIGKDPLRRERHWSNMKRALRKYDRMGIAPLDIALWDLAGKYHDVPVHQLLGGFRDRLATYASTSHGDPEGGLDSPEAYADFAAQCRDWGFPAFKIHTWDVTDGRRDLQREIDTVHAVGDRVGDDMDLMLDPACDFETFSEALEVGKACDEQGYFWYEDPMRDGGHSQHAASLLRERLDTPLLMTEMTRSFEGHTDFVANRATDLVRADPRWDSGITGAMKIARMAEGFGLDVEFHGAGPAQRHCMAATRNTNYYELVHVHPEFGVVEPNVYVDYEDSIEAIDEDGRVPVPDSPGLGVEADWNHINAHRVETHRYD